MPTKSDEIAMNLYKSIMEEIKVRALSINTATNSPNGLPPALIREFCFLQLRMMCELRHPARATARNRECHTEVASNSRALQLGRVERLKLVDIAGRLGLLIPLEIAQCNRLGREIHQQKAVLLDRLYSFLHVEMLRW